MRFQHVFTAYCCVFREIPLVGSNQRNYLENANTRSKGTLKTRVATRLNRQMKWQILQNNNRLSCCVSEKQREAAKVEESVT